MPDATIWEKCDHPIIPRRTASGGWTDWVGQTWRRRRADGRWEYQQDEETEDEWDARNASGW